MTPRPARATPSDRARRRMTPPGERPLFLADWDDVLFVHFAIDPTTLRPHVPFPLDLFRGRAYVSLVCFTQRRLRPRVGGRLAALLSAPLAEHAFLNVRTYVRRAGGRGIYFLAEWIPNRLAALVGPPMYGLPYRLGRLRYTSRARAAPSALEPPRALRGFSIRSATNRETAKRLPGSAADSTRAHYRAEVTAPIGRLLADAPVPTTALRPALPGLERFLLERYTAFTFAAGTERRFRVWHEPWQCTPVEVSLPDTTLLRHAFPWFTGAALISAHHSPGVRDVWIGPPRTIRCADPSAAGGRAPRSAVDPPRTLRGFATRSASVREYLPAGDWLPRAARRVRSAVASFAPADQAPPISGRKKGGGVMSLGCPDNPRAAEVTFETPG